MSLHTWADYKLELYDKDRTLVGDHLDQAIGLRWKQQLYGRGEFSFSLPLGTDAADRIAHDALHFVRIWRGAQDDSLLDGVIFKPSWKKARKDARYLEVAGSSLAAIARWRCAVPLAGPLPVETTDYVDDAMKWIVERTIGQYAPTVPGGSSRVVPDLIVDTPTSAYPTQEKLTFVSQPGFTLWDFLLKWGAHFHVDWDFRFNAAMQIVFYTYYPRRGVDRTETNGVVQPVIMNDAAENLKAWSFYWDAGEAKNVIISRKCDEEFEDAAAVASWWRREMISESSDATTNEVALTDNAVKIGYEHDFVESEQCAYQDGAEGATFDVGDDVTVNNIEEDYGPKDETIAEVVGAIQGDGSEVLGIVFGDPEPNVLDKQSSGGAATSDDPYEDLSDDDPEPVANANAPGILDKFSRQDHIHDLNITADDAGVMPLTAGVGYIAGANGIVTKIVGGKLVVDGALLAGVSHTHAHGDLTGVTADQHHAGFIGLTIGATNIDPNASDRIALVEGSYISLTPAAGQMTIAATGLVPTSRTVTAGNGLTGGGALSGNITLNVGAGDGITVNADDVALTTPGTLTVSTSNSAAGNHTHAITTTTAGAASTIVATDANGYVTAVRFRFDDSEYLSTSGGTVIYNASNFHRFYIGAEQHLIVQSGYVFPGVTNTTQLGQSTYRWSNVYSVLGNFSSTITAGGGSTAIACSGNITMVAGKTVDGVDISAHVHDYRKVEDNGLDDTDGVKTSTWTATGTPWWNTNVLRRTSDGVQIFLANTAFNTTGGTGYTQVSIGASKHYHYVGYSDTADTSAPV
ncbi:MAG: hypothetical protein BPHS0_20 [Phage 5P_3]|nr:MAG: hypothetical protein BPHS0_20 [Phage 5P_3]